MRKKRVSSFFRQVGSPIDYRIFTGVDLSVHLRKGKFTSQEEKLVDDAITDYLAAKGANREHDLVEMLFGEGFLAAGDGEAGANAAAGPKARAKNKGRVELVKAIGESWSS